MPEARKSFDVTQFSRFNRKPVAFEATLWGPGVTDRKIVMIDMQRVRELIDLLQASYDAGVQEGWRRSGVGEADANQTNRR